MGFSTMYIASTGLQALGTGMGTISNNLANVNTVGFKTMRTNYQDLISEAYYCGNGMGLQQLGKGSQVASIQSMFTQGAFKSSEQDSDLAIAGEGFFNVRNARTGEIMYTRAGVYTFSKDGYMQDPSFNVLQGWEMSVPKPGEKAQRLGDPVDIQITALTAPPEATTDAKVAVNLNADDKSSYPYPATVGGSADWEGLGYAGAWDAGNKPPIPTSSYSHAEPMTVYDSEGTAHNVMIYYQKNPHMENVWDYLVALENPSEDARGSDAGGLLADGASFAGLIQKGKITFSAEEGDSGAGGLIKSIEAQNLDLGNSVKAYTDAIAAGAGASEAMSTASIGGYYSGSPEPNGNAYVSTERTYTLTWGYKDPATGLWSDSNSQNPPTSAITWEDDLGNIGYITVSDKKYPGPYNFGSGLSISFEGNNGLELNFGQPGSDSITVTAHSEVQNWAEASPNDQGYFDVDLSFAGKGSAGTLSQTVSVNMGAQYAGGDVWIPDEFSTTQYAAKSSVTFKEVNGYPESSLQRVSVQENGLVVGVYSQGREIELYQLCLTRFSDPWGLTKVGDNLFQASRYSGDGYTNVPGENGNGKVLGNFLEQSNVDTATEIVQMILTQRGFQANSKAITTNDTMLATAIQTKRLVYSPIL